MSDIDFEKIKEAVRARDQFISENPQIQVFQDQINDVLKKAGSNSHNRQVALQTFMLETWAQIVDVWEKKD